MLFEIHHGPPRLIPDHFWCRLAGDYGQDSTRPNGGGLNRIVRWELSQVGEPTIAISPTDSSPARLLPCKREQSRETLLVFPLVRRLPRPDSP